MHFYERKKAKIRKQYNQVCTACQLQDVFAQLRVNLGSGYSRFSKPGVMLKYEPGR